jgi:hypothetical protein
MSALLQYANTGKITANDYDLDSDEAGKPSWDGAKVGVLFSAEPTQYGLTKVRRIYWRSWTESSHVWGSAVDVSGADAAGHGWGSPDHVRMGDGKLIAAYDRDALGGSGSGFYGFMIKESADSGVTWANPYSGAGLFDTDKLIGIITDSNDQSICYAFTQGPVNIGGKITVHIRTGVATWSPFLVWQNNGILTEGWNFNYFPFQAAVAKNGRVILFGNRIIGNKSSRLGCLYNVNVQSYNSWQEGQALIDAPGTDVFRIPMAVVGSDNHVRVVYTHDVINTYGGSPTYRVAISVGMSPTWDLGNYDPEAFHGTDDDGYPINLPNSWHNWSSLAIDAKNRMLLIIPDETRAKFNLYRCWGTRPSDWRLLGGGPLVRASDGLAWTNAGSELPGASVMAGNNLYRVVPVWNPNLAGDPTGNTPWDELWLCVVANAGTDAGGRTGGGGGGPRSFPVDG